MLDNEVNKNEQVQVARRVMLGNVSEGISSLSAMPLESSSVMSEMPRCPKGGVIVKVCYAGICYSEGYVRKSQFRPALPGIEIAGVVNDVCNTLPNSNIIPGDKVIIFPDEDMRNDGFREFIAVEDTENIVQIPSSIPLEVASMLPGSALSAYNAVLKAQPHVEKLQKVKSCVNVLVVGAGSLGLWTLRLANYLIGQENSNIRLFVADNSIDKLITAQEHDCHDIIHWCEEDHEQYIIERTLDACRGGVDVVVDFVSSPRTMMRSLKCLNREGLILVGGNAMAEVSINLNTLAAKQQSIVGIPRGTVEQLRFLVETVADKKIEPPSFSVHNVEETGQVLEELYECRLTGRAVLRFNYDNTTSGTADITDN
ncbi:uncharacterized protein LOC123535595 [Mercenaria mercenaria]|uniref:uncharacterized protein LOC123535595 n=1 Tax=Mercenaria mercenaria TaxID=6596 RepID=UPI001E1DAAAB|nr:uncharacterized protein LOC123535595 [Mercenaria mercenaria]XP_045174242.1 uncharacterized protein LOC123535595 [Mercenaria mercenaria]